MTKKTREGDECTRNSGSKGTAKNVRGAGGNLQKGGPGNLLAATEEHRGKKTETAWSDRSC